MIVSVAKGYMLETLRNFGVLFGNILPPIIFLICSVLVKSFLDSPETVEFMIKGQFLPISILLLLFSFSLSSATIYLAELKAHKTFHWLKRTDVSPFIYFLGMGVGVFLFMNLLLILLLIGYAWVASISITSFLMIHFICNLILLALYPASFIIAGIVKDEKVAQSLLVPGMIILMFSITMPSLFLTIGGANPQDYYIFLSWNPMLYLFDTLHAQLQLIDHTWLNLYHYALILIGFSIIFSILAKKIYNR
ncbi:ABC transporter permease [Oceanobacillus sp. J11TS1]|uniref:ABC transporter permease n=1 Tax=Oceanobacillus sp. J11TS1 TaxID=2807191 RepID=UPI001B1B9711|nr:ABC transporter permease [Oceanobacillus sp. J11TS1]GIO23765.1 ABC transporter permease [Oceanobacillus sp. J11TS1]